MRRTGKGLLVSDFEVSVTFPQGLDFTPWDEKAASFAPRSRTVSDRPSSQVSLFLLAGLTVPGAAKSQYRLLGSFSWK